LKIVRKIETDVLVIGGGAAASRTALAAVETGAHTTMVLKRKLGASGATNYPENVGSAWQAADGCGGEGDTPDAHYADIMRAALGMADARMARIQADEAPERLLELESWGFDLIHDPKGGRPHYSGYSCFGTQPRAHGFEIGNTGGHTGNMIETLRNKFMPLGVQLEQDLAVVDLLVDNKVCTGALALNSDGDLVQFNASAVVMAVGGASQMFPLSHTPGDITGDGYAMALRAGAELLNMEFMQYMVRDVGGKAPRVGGPYWTLNPKMVDVDGNEILEANLPDGLSAEEVYLDRTLHYPFSSRDNSVWLDVAIERTVRAGRGGPHNGVFVDFSDVDISSVKPARPQHHPPADILELGDDRIEVAHSAHAINGGVRITENGETSIPGFYAVGETIAGPHGADRLGGGMLGSCNVFGARTGKAAGEFAKATTRTDSGAAVETVLGRLADIGEKIDQPWNEVRGQLKKLAGASLVALRSKGSLTTMLSGLDELAVAGSGGTTKDSPDSQNTDLDKSLIRHIETANLLTVAEVMTKAALSREESRGSHFREDFPTRNDDEWNTNLMWDLSETGLNSRRVKYRQNPDLDTQFVNT
jgi:fumarate reductase (CoM/CoB) subunit A